LQKYFSDKFTDRKAQLKVTSEVITHTKNNIIECNINV